MIIYLCFSIKPNQQIITMDSSFIDDILNQAEQYLIEEQNKTTKSNNTSKYNCDCTSGPDITDHDGLILCCICGMVLEKDILCYENESPIYGSGEDGVISNTSTRCSGSIDPIMGKSNYSLTIAGKGRMQTLYKWGMFEYEEIVMMNAKRIFSEAIRVLKVPNMAAKQAIYFYKQAYNLKVEGKKVIVRGKNKTATLACCLYFSLQNLNLMLPLNTILEYFEIDNTTFSKNSKFLQQHLSSSVFQEINDPCEHIHRLCANLDIPFKIQKICKMILKASISLSIFPESQNLTGCCAAIYFATSEINDTVNIDLLSSTSKVPKESILKTSKAISEQKIKIFNFIKNQKN
jgi:transcription initiation factor TFIIIB Brf1 subunit/transcription initiation factor TFIIB